MLIEEISKELTREEFKNYFKDDEMGIHFEYDIEYDDITYICPEDLGLEEVEDCKSETWNCYECWLKAIENIKFKGEK